MTAVANDTTASYDENIHQYYSLKNVYRFERIFGVTWVSTGGESTTKEICMRLKLRPGMKVLDIGCGTGGSTFHMARQYGCIVTGIDLCTNMIALANQRLMREEEVVRKRVTLVNGNTFQLQFPENEFDVIYSRDVIMHVKNKEDLFTRIHPWLKPGGKLLITEYVRGDHEISSFFVNYLAERKFHLKTFSEYQNCLKKSGFHILEAENMLEKFRKISEDELAYFLACKEAFLIDFSEEDFDWMVKNWKAKVVTTQSGDQSWCLYICTK